MQRYLPNLDSMVNEIITFVRSGAQGLEIGEVERRLISIVMALGRAALEEYVSAKGTGYAGRQFVDGQGRLCYCVRDRSCVLALWPINS